MLARATRADSFHSRCNGNGTARDVLYHAQLLDPMRNHFTPVLVAATDNYHTLGGSNVRPDDRQRCVAIPRSTDLLRARTSACQDSIEEEGQVTCKITRITKVSSVLRSSSRYRGRCPSTGVG